MYVCEESHCGIVPMNHSNRDGASSAESEEGRLRLSRVVEDDIEGPFVLGNEPIVGEGMLAKDLGVNGIELASNAVGHFGPLSFELTIHQALSLGQVGDPEETVVLLQVIETSGLHLSRPAIPVR